MKATLQQITKTINLARAEEEKNASLTNHFKAMGDLPTSIAISARSPDAALHRFVCDYVNSLPLHLQAFYEISQEAGIEKYLQTFLNLVCAYFLQPPELLKIYEGLEGAFYKTYLCQRILEEVNDQIMNFSGAALVPMDMTTANIICHALIGDELANALDHLVLLSMETSEADKSVFTQENVKQFMAKRKFSGWDEVLERWPCFSKDHGLNLQLGGC